MSTSLRWPAPAKINLFLHVLGRRADGYHDLQTVFQFLDLQDEIELIPRRDGQIRRLDASSEIPENRDLTVAAARLLQERCASRAGVDLRVHKRIPLGAGLGGGSSDAATTLVGLNSLWELGLSAEALERLGLSLGADVPVFVRGRAAWAEGVGERLYAVDLDEPWYAVLTPPCQVSTAEVFADPALTRNGAPLKIADLLAGVQPMSGRFISTRALLERSRNDCEAVTRRRYPEVAEALERLAPFGEPRMTGTGGSVFMTVERTAGARALRDLPAGWRGFLARGLNRSPLHALLDTL